MEAGKCLIIVRLKRCPRVSYHQRSSGGNLCRKEGGLILSLPFHRRCFCSLPRGGDLCHQVQGSAMGHFYSRPRVGGDFYYTIPLQGGFYFYSRPRVGGDPPSPQTVRRPASFLLTPPRGGRHVGWLPLTLYDKFLLTPQNRGRTHRRGTPQAETGV